MTSRRFEQLPPERQKEILRIAADEFAAHGFRGTSYNQLLVRMGFGKGSAYYYFADKQDLFLTVVKASYRAFFESMGALHEPIEAAEFWPFVEHGTRLGIEFMQNDPTAAAMLQCFARERTGLDLLASRELLETFDGYYARILELGQRLGVVRQDLPFSFVSAMVLGVSSAFDQWLISEHPQASAAESKLFASYFTDMARRMLEPAPSEPSPPKRSASASPVQARPRSVERPSPRPSKTRGRSKA